MDYQKIMCEFCKNCTEYKLNKRVIKSGSFVSGDITSIKCENFIPKLNFKSSTEKCCSFFRDYDEIEADNEQIEDRICGY